MIPITPSNYTTIDSLINEINVRINMYLPAPYSVVLSLTSLNRVRLLISGMRPITFSIVDTNLSYYILGFRQELDILVDMVIGKKSFIIRGKICWIEVPNAAPIIEPIMPIPII